MGMAKAPRTTTEVEPVTPEESGQLFLGVYSLFYASVNLAAALDEVPEALRRRTSSGDRSASSALRVLLHLRLRGDEASTIGDLAKAAGVSVGWASRVIDDLESMDLTQRVRGASDRRVVHVRLTEAGGALCQRMWRNRERPIVNALASLPKLHRPLAIRFLETLATEFDKAAAKAD